MSIEPEDMLEGALRLDLPTFDAQARIRRRLLAAGVAVGNGVAATAAASGVGAGTVGVGAKLAGLSWGLKVGLAAVVAIPTVGLWLDGRPPRHAAVQSPIATPARAVETKPLLVAHVLDTPNRARETAAEDSAAAPGPGPGHAQPPAVKTAAVDAASPGMTPPSAVHPSQSDFAATEPPARAPQVGSTLAEETRLLDSAFAELGAGHRARAAELIHEHEARFPTGLLQQERERARTRLSKMSRGE